MTFNNEVSTPLMTEQFSLSNDHKINYRYLYNVLDMLSDFGGIYGTFIVPLFMFVGNFINSKINKAKLIRSLFLIKRKDIYESLNKEPLLKTSVRQ